MTQPLTWQSRCLGCHRLFTATEAYVDLCPPCQTDEDALYGQERDKADVEYEPPSWSRAAMRERLGVTGDKDE